MADVPQHLCGTTEDIFIFVRIILNRIRFCYISELNMNRANHKFIMTLLNL